MTIKQRVPTTQGTEQGQVNSIAADWLRPNNQHKGTKKTLPPLQRRVKTLLSNGGQYSTAEISMALHIADPRSVIRHLRHSGVKVSDVWVTGRYGNRFKRYFIF